ncbi:MAG: helix-turn-helix domain-containing protein [Niveispirillum sp.]|uniref:helix-turn-helix domain-containing protein n=1 Tax=Niveispirillum sp. TaxID=1917217 RepID=UPI00403529B4
MTANSIDQRTGNVFADLGMPDPESHLLKAQLVARLASVLKDQGLTQADAAQRVGVSQPDISRLLCGQFRDISVERLLRMLVRLGCAVDIVVKPTSDAAPTPLISVV